MQVRGKPHEEALSDRTWTHVVLFGESSDAGRVVHLFHTAPAGELARSEAAFVTIVRSLRIGPQVDARTLQESSKEG